MIRLVKLGKALESGFLLRLKSWFFIFIIAVCMAPQARADFLIGYAEPQSLSFSAKTTQGETLEPSGPIQGRQVRLKLPVFWTLGWEQFEVPLSPDGVGTAKIEEWDIGLHLPLKWLDAGIGFGGGNLWLRRDQGVPFAGKGGTRKLTLHLGLPLFKYLSVYGQFHWGQTQLSGRGLDSTSTTVLGTMAGFDALF